MIRLITCLLLLSNATSFAPTLTSRTSHRLFSAAPLQTEEEVAADPFESYDSTSLEQKTVATRDVSIGSGAVVTDGR
jgi:hypothetical protein